MHSYTQKHTPHLWFIHPLVPGPFASSRGKYVGRVEGGTALALVQAGKVVLVPVALADGLVPLSPHAFWGSLHVEEAEARGEVTHLPPDQTSKTGEKHEQSLPTRDRHPPAEHWTVCVIEKSLCIYQPKLVTVVQYSLDQSTPAQLS